MRTLLFFIFLPFDTVFLYYVLRGVSQWEPLLKIDFFSHNMDPLLAVQVFLFFSAATLLSAIGAWAFYSPKTQNRDDDFT